MEKITEMIYRIDDKEVDKETFEKKVTEQPEHEFITRALVDSGEVYIIDKSTSAKRKRFIYFACAPKVVREMKEVIAQNELDPLGDDSFNIAWALYKSGFGYTLEK